MKTLKEIRTKMKLSRADVAHLSGLTTATILNLETGRRELNVRHAVAIAVALNIQPHINLEECKIMFTLRD